MMKTISARDANQAFSRLLKEVEKGEEVVITKHGEPVAVLSAYRPGQTGADREAAIDRFVRMMRKGLPLGARRFTRDEMHER
jgi:prevent-host-death family protein